MLCIVGAVTDDARDDDRVEECLGLVVMNERDGERVACFNALIPLSVLIFLGEANHLPMSNDGTNPRMFTNFSFCKVQSF